MMRILMIVFLMAALTSSVLADLTVVQAMESGATPTEPDKAATLTMKMKGPKARIDFSDKMISSIVDLKSKQLFFLDHKQKQVMAMPLDMMQSMLALLAPEAAAQDKSAIQKTGKVQAINGYTCEEYAGSSVGGMTLRCWMADVPDASEMEPFRVYMQDVFKTTSFGGMAAMKGLIVRSESTVLINDKPMTSRTELKGLSRAPLADAIFSLPADYRVINLPALPMP